MNPDDTHPPVPSSQAGNEDAGELWPSSGSAKGLRVRLPIAVAAMVVVALVGAAAGASLKKTSSNSTTQAGAISHNGGTTAANGTGRSGAGGVFGTVTKIDGNTITVTQRDGTTATVVVPSATTITKTVSGALSDLKTGASIIARGTTANGKTTASNITIAPTNGADQFGGFGGRNHQNDAGTGGTTTN